MAAKEQSSTPKNVEKVLENHIKLYQNPLEFESLAGLHGRKWRENIKYEGKHIGKWLTEQDCDPSSQRGLIDRDTHNPHEVQTHLLVWV